MLPSRTRLVNVRVFHGIYLNAYFGNSVVCSSFIIQLCNRRGLLFAISREKVGIVYFDQKAVLLNYNIEGVHFYL